MDRIYLDHASSMPVDPRVLDFSKPFLLESGNPSSLYEFGQEANGASFGSEIKMTLTLRSLSVAK